MKTAREWASLFHQNPYMDRLRDAASMKHREAIADDMWEKFVGAIRKETQEAIADDMIERAKGMSDMGAAIMKHMAVNVRKFGEI